MCSMLVEVPPDDWCELRDLFLAEWPVHEFAYYLLQNYTKWQRSQLKETLDVTIYSLDGHWRQDGTFLLKDNFELYFYCTSLTTHHETLVKALSRLPWETLHEVSLDFPAKFRPAVNEVIAAKQLTITNDQLTNYYFLAREKAAALTVAIPTGWRLSNVELAHLNTIYKQWPLRHSISYDAGYGLLRRLIMLNDSVGLFDSNGQLIAWCLSDQTGAHSDLQTVAHQLRKGYGRIVVKELAKRLAIAGADSRAFVLRSNDRSIRLFESVGFEKLTDLHWMIVSGKSVS